MQEKKMISIISENGDIDQAEQLMTFHLDEFNKDYVVYTKEETDENGNVTVYVSEITKEEEGKVELNTINSEKEWSKIKEVLVELSKAEE